MHASYIVALIFWLAPAALAASECVFDEDAGSPEALSLIQRQGQYQLKTPETRAGESPKSKGATHRYSLAAMESRADTYDSRTGLIGCVLAFITYGIFLACPKLVKPSTSGVAYQFYVSLGLLFSTLIALPILGERLVITWLSLLSGLILVVCLVFTLASIWTIGLTWFSQIQPPLAAIVGFLFAHFVLLVAARSMVLASLGLLLMCLGIVAANNLIFNRISDSKQLAHSGATQTSESSNNLILGCVEALIAGVMGGLIFAPSRFAPVQYENASFCLGISVAFAVCCTCAVAVCALKDRLTLNALAGTPKMLVRGRFDVASSLPIGLLQGTLLGLANIFTLYGCFSPIGVGVTTAVRNSAGCATVLWGAFVFKEYGDLDFGFKVKLLLAVALVIPGVVMLLAFGEA